MVAIPAGFANTAPASPTSAAPAPPSPAERVDAGSRTTGLPSAWADAPQLVQESGGGREARQVGPVVRERPVRHRLGERPARDVLHVGRARERRLVELTRDRVRVG